MSGAERDFHFVELEGFEFLRRISTLIKSYRNQISEITRGGWSQTVSSIPGLSTNFVRLCNGLFYRIMLSQISAPVTKASAFEPSVVVMIASRSW